MKKILLTLSLVLGGMLSASAQNTINITLKDGTVLTAPADMVERANYTMQGSVGDNIFSDEFSVNCMEYIDEVHFATADSMKVFTFNMSDRLRSCFQDFSAVQIYTPRSGQTQDTWPGYYKLSGYMTFISLLHPGTGSRLYDYEPVYQPIVFRFTGRFREGAFTFTKTAECTVYFKPNTLPVEDAYYLVTAGGDWKPVAMTHVGANKYDGAPFTVTFGAPRNGTQRVDERWRIVPASALTAGGFDRSLSLGLEGDTVGFDSQYGYFGKLAAGADKDDVVLRADDGFAIYTLSYTPSFNVFNVTGESADYLFDRCYSNLGFANAERDANGYCDVDCWDGSSTSMLRQLLNLNELTTDHLLCTWLDSGISDLNFNRWTPATPQLEGLYLRLQKGVEYCNKFLTVKGSDAMKRAEVRFLRAYYNSQLLDLFGQVPVYTDMNTVNPPCMQRKDLFDYLVAELTDCVSDMAAPRSLNETDAGYGRVDQAAAWMLLARLYLNAEVYTGTAQWQKAAEYARKVVDCGAYGLYTVQVNGWSAYQQLFMGDNGTNGAAREALMVIPYEGATANDWGALGLMAGALNSDMHDAQGGDFGTSEHWGGYIVRPQLVEKFFPNGNVPYADIQESCQYAGDDRALFWSWSRLYDLSSPDNFYSGFSVAKYNNRHADGTAPTHPQFNDYDVFLMRYAEALLTLAEADMRLGNVTEAASLINQLRNRAHAATRTTYTLQDVLDEWSREFYFEGRHRTDLIRFGLYGGSSGYQWTWKGGVFGGVPFDSFRNVFPLPQAVLGSNPHATQNPGY